MVVLTIASAMWRIVLQADRTGAASTIQGDDGVPKFLLITLLLATSGCATIVEGTGQSVAIETQPAGATCNLQRAGIPIGSISQTPGSVHIDKSKNDLQVACAKDGYVPASVSQTPRFVGTTFGNLIIGGIAGFVIDAVSGANYTYPDRVNVVLAPVAPAAVVAPEASNASPIPQS